MSFVIARDTWFSLYREQWDSRLTERVGLRGLLAGGFCSQGSLRQTFSHRRAVWATRREGGKCRYVGKKVAQRRYGNLAYRCCACSTSGSQNLAALPKRHDNTEPFSSNLTKEKAMLKSFWPLLIIKLRIWRVDEEQHILFKITQLLPYLATLNYERVAMPNTRRPIFGTKLEAWRHKMFHIFHFLQSDMLLGIGSPFSWIFFSSPKPLIHLFSQLFVHTKD